MDINSELATRTVAYLELLSELLAEKQALSSKQPPTLAELNAIWTAGQPAGGQPPQHPLLAGLPAALLPADRLVPSAPLKERTAQLVASRRRLDPAAFPRPADNASQEARTEQYWQDFLVQGRALLWCLHAWQESIPEEAEPVSRLLEQPEILPARWRRQLRRHLYAYPASRLQLAQCLDLLPALIHNLEEQQSTNRLNQLGQWLPLEWRPAASELQGEVLTRQWALRADWLAHPEKLELVLEQTECAVPFEHVFAQELADVTARRAYQGQEAPAAAAPAPAPESAAPPTPPGRSPWDIARHLKLRGLGLSGGGIRSASFNLGVLQAMAQAGALTELDYLSTVSGGGYIGSWLVAWMKRAGSAAKVQDLLCPDKAPNPLSEETRPIRWLRSYSNYLAPRSSAFSTDMWTIGVTWLRNTLLNQVVVALTLGAVLAMCYPLLLIWQSDAYLQPMTKAALGVAVALIPCIIIGRMLRRYALRRWGPRSGLTSTVLLTASLLALGYLGSSYAYTLDPDKTDLFWPGIAILGLLLLGLGVVIWFANYPSSSPEVPRWRLITQLVLATILSALAGVALLYGAVALIQKMPGWQWASIAQQTPYPIHYNPPVYWPDGNTLLPRAFLMWTEKMAWVQHEQFSSARPTLPLAFVFGPPLVVEALALMVTLRMGLLGRYVPDDRREWWGRLGALMQLLLFAWILVTGTALVAPVLLMRLPAMGLALPATIGGWMLLVGKGVQWAQGALTPAQSSPTAAPRSPFRDLVARVVPYVFALGLLVLMSWGVAALLRHLSQPQPFGMAAALQVGGVGILLALGLAACLGVNEFSMHHFYRNRLVRAYLGASRAGVNRQPNPFTGFDGQDDLPLYTLGWQQSDRAPAGQAQAAHGKLYDGPIPIINVALNVSRGQDLANQDRKAESFVFTPRHCGFDFARLRPALEARAPHEYGYRPTYGYSAAEGPSLGSAMTISGAAVNPNMGYHSSSVTAFLLTVFNVRLGWWMGNPLGRAWRRAGPRRGLFYLLGDLFGRTSADDRYVNLSDGGHFDNLGLYELVRRRCQFIILSDSEEDAQLQFEGLGNAIRRCRIDFGVEIHLDPTSIGRAAGSQYSQVHVVRGRIIYPDWPKGLEGVLLYIKSSLTGDEPVDVRQFAAENARFPHESTGDQFFTEPQLESYRQLGYHIARGAF